MTAGLRGLARRLLGVTRTSTYYLPWLVRPPVGCILLVNNIESRFKSEFNRGPFPVTITQYGADGRIARRYEVSLADSGDTADLELQTAPGGVGVLTVRGERILSGSYALLTDGRTYSGTHGRQENWDAYPWPARALLAVLGTLLAPLRRTVPAFTLHQYGFVGPDSRSYFLLMNLSNVTNRLRASANGDGRRGRVALLTLPPHGTCLFDVRRIAPPRAERTVSLHMRLEGNARFNLYVVGAGPKDLDGALSLMHVK